MTWLPVLVLCLSLSCITNASKMCVEDEDCADLGDVFCMKSRCQWGLCGCPRGQAMRFLGSEKKFQCVPIHRVGESCSTDGDAGVCGAMNSECIDGRCQCSDFGGVRYSYWGGEHCDTQLKSASGETCSDSLGNNCLLSGGSASCYRSNSWWTGPLQSLPNTCSCGTGSRVALENDFEDHAFTGKTVPGCVPIKIEELCLRDSDCQSGGQSGMECVNNKCACVTAGHVPDLGGTRCASRLGKGVVCTGVAGHCDGTQGLVCGDVCDVENYNDGTVNKRCVCDPSYADSGSGCTKATESTSCDRDYQCKSLSRTAVCVEGICKAGARLITGSLVILMAALLVSINVIS